MGLLFHYIKIAFRNMRKHKKQTLISILGLAVGFTCFAMATLWVRYEMTFDSFHKNAKQMYVVYSPMGGRLNAYLLGDNLKQTFPEIAKKTQAFASAAYAGTIIVDGVEISGLTIKADSSFLDMFDVKILEGSLDFLIANNNNVAITHEKALQLFGNERPIGKAVTIWNREFTICAVVSGMSKRSNYAFDLICPFLSEEINDWSTWAGNIIIELFPGTNLKAFEEKLYEYEDGNDWLKIQKLTITPISKLRYTDPNVEREVPFQHILIFSLSGLLVILCSLFNYTTLFVSRFRIRQKELALRKVFFASGYSLLAMLLVEFLLTIFFATILAYCLAKSVQQPFMSLSDISINLSAIYLELLMYIGIVIFISLLAFLLTLFFSKRATINDSFHRINTNIFRKISVIAQLLISIGIVFCTIIIFKQMYYLNHTSELGFSFHNMGLISMSEGDVDGNSLESHLKQIPEITEFVYGKWMKGLMPEKGRRTTRGISDWDDKPYDAKVIGFDIVDITQQYYNFYDFKLVMGETLTDTDPKSMVLLNESAVMAFGWYDNPIGKQFLNGQYTVKGIIKNVHNLSPTTPVKPCFYQNIRTPDPALESMMTMIIQFKYKEGMWKSCKEKIEQMFRQQYTGFDITIYNSEEEYDKNFKSEKNLVKLFSFVSTICVMICVFGFVSLISLTCEERRKSIAIRKINGAMVNDILVMFIKEYFLLLIIGAVIAFFIAYIIMQRWLEQYVKQTSIPAWIYLGITFVMALMIVLCVGWQVYKVSIENPTEVIKSE